MIFTVLSSAKITAAGYLRDRVKDRKETVMSNESRIVLALDGLDSMRASELIKKLGDGVYAYKITDMWDRASNEIIRCLKKESAPRIWVDTKLHDIPDTVARRAHEARQADILSVHACGGRAMVAAAVEHGPPEIYASTLLTSLTEDEIKAMYAKDTVETSMHLARIALAGGAHGIVCDPEELPVLASDPKFRRLKLVANAIRSADECDHDHRRVISAKDAIAQCADLLVVGRPVTQASDPIDALKRLTDEIAWAENEFRKF